jgi:hypothetical protein
MHQAALSDSSIGPGLSGVLRCFAPALLALAWQVPAHAWQESSPPPRARSLAGDLSGTWRGLMSDGEQSTDSQFTFGESGYLVIEYTNNQGTTRAVELSEVGQQVQYVPDGGGVRTLEVLALEKSPGRLGLRLRNSFERTSGGYLDQRYSEELLLFRLTSAGLEVEMRISTTSGFGDRDMSVSGGDTSVERGVLQRVR